MTARPRAAARRSRPTRRTLAATAALVAVSALALGACSGTAEAGTTDGGSSDVNLQVGELGTAPTQEALLEAAGENDDLGYDVTYSLFASGPAFTEAVPSGSVDLALMADTPSIFAQVGKIPIKVVGVQRSVADGESSVEIVAKADSGIASVADLKGRKVALLPATILQYTVVEALEQAGLSYSDITPVELPLADATTALERGDVDAVASLDPILSQIKAGGAVVVGSGEGITSGYSYVVATDDALADPAKADAVEDYLGRLGRAREWSVAHPEEWAAKYAELTGLPEALALTTIERGAAGWVPIDADVIAKQQAQADAYTDLGLIKQKLDVTAEFDDRYNTALTATKNAGDDE